MKTKSKNLSVARVLRLTVFFSMLITCMVLLPGCGGEDGGGGSGTGTPGNDGGGGNPVQGYPTVTIDTPSNNQVIEKGTPVTFRGTALDPEDGILPENSLVWRSSRDGQIGTGSSLNGKILSAGKHTITLTATDSSGNVKTASLEIIIDDPSIEPPGSWAKIFNKLGDDVARSIQQTDDGGYIVAGYTAADDTYCYILKLDSAGSLVWDRTFPDSGNGEAYSIQQTSDGGYIMGGYIVAEDGSNDFYVLKLDGDGDLEWEETYGNMNNEVAKSVQQTTDGGYIAAGYTEYTEGDEGSDIYVVRLQSDGSLIWDEVFDNGGYEDACSIQETADNGYIIAGSTDSEGDLHGYLVKIDQDGFEDWSKILPGNGYTEILSIRRTTDRGYIAAGYSSGVDNFNFDSYVVKLDENGNEDWHKTFGRAQGDEEAASVQEIQGGGYIIAGYTKSLGTGGRDFYIIKLDAGGMLVWDQTFGSTEDEEARSIYQISDGGYIVAGTRTIGGDGDFYLIKLESNGTLSTTDNQ
ncbi:MAG: PQQ-binding-like beta-propeller repeat protein [bacterium]